VANRCGTFHHIYKTHYPIGFPRMATIQHFPKPVVFCYLDIPNSYEHLLQDMKCGNINLVSDGSYYSNHSVGTAAWILEGSVSGIQITGAVITPEVASDQSAYRSELAGILAAISVINALAKFHHISTNITIHCDCQKGLDKVFNLSSMRQLRFASSNSI
jgi:hypothetical protein